ncbi:hypothetical protein [Salisediminibacterium halotolerans]|uniref:Uncharacterized protein n=1 Tax=Salisediminibacterium halotolerans TaxID=517425 RepID=A0A1H9ULW4_9BACI|nr:hypothetical protein [Salisediminibacterium haloalkalitolerans]SES10339.1 hypothetical protein SAMN05444126_1158 [Salisediminibacterium haloalkalitolerans]
MIYAIFITVAVLGGLGYLYLMSNREDEGDDVRAEAEYEILFEKFMRGRLTEPEYRRQLID